MAIEGHKGQRWWVFQLLARLKINALPCVKALGTESDGGLNEEQSKACKRAMQRGPRRVTS